jgi:membrane-associated protease RseP (regulator of RpoE activity)
MMALGILAFVVALLTSVMLHEAGHFTAAKLFKMKATQFFVGFGPTLWSRQKGETEYGIKAIPAGGFVKIIGMTPLEEIAPEDQSRAFINKPGWQRFIVLVAGSTMHFVIAIVLLFVLFVGWPSVVHGAGRVAAVEKCVPTAADGSCPPGSVAAPAVGKLQQDDIITAIDGQPVVHGSGQLASLIRHAAAGPLTLTVQRAEDPAPPAIHHHRRRHRHPAAVPATVRLHRRPHRRGGQVAGERSRPRSARWCTPSAAASAIPRRRSAWSEPASSAATPSITGCGWRSGSSWPS